MSVMLIVRVPLLAALLLLFAAAVGVALVPAGIALDRRVTGEMRRAAVEDLGRAPMILEDRNRAQAEALAMHAMAVASVEGLEAAVREGRHDVAEALAREAVAEHGEDPVVITAEGEPIVGPSPGPTPLQVLRREGTWAGYVVHAGVPRAVGLAAISGGSGWHGAAGAMTAFGEEMASTLGGLSRSYVTIVSLEGDVVASTLAPGVAAELRRALSSGDGVYESEKVSAVLVHGEEHWVAEGELPGAGHVIFSRTVAEELAALPGIRRSYISAGLVTLALALGVGAMVALVIVRPVRALALAADHVRSGDFEAPVPRSRVEEVERLGGAFRAMRGALEKRLTELRQANDALEERQQRLTALQGELIHRDRLAASARMATELAHEIRNPVANIRNCLEVVRRGLTDESESARFADMAIDELLRMHELAESLLDLHRPAGGEGEACDPSAVANQVAALAHVGATGVTVRVEERPGEASLAALPADVLKQILFAFVQNAGEAGGPGTAVDIVISRAKGSILIYVLDDGPGIADDALDRLFDPFFTTKGSVTGVGLGLFVAEGLARRYGARIDGGNRPDGAGACFTIEAPAANEEGRVPAHETERAT